MGVVLDKEERLAELVKELGRICNDMSYQPDTYGKVLSREIQREHRTIQQSIIATLTNVLLSYRSASHDGRNEYSVEFCEKLHNLLVESGQNFTRDGDVYFPFI